MTQPIDPKKSTRLGQISFFQICKWITDHMVEIIPGKTHAELCQFLNEVEELMPIMPAGGLGIHSIPSIIRATGYTPAAPGSRSKKERTKITKAKFQELERKVAKVREEIENLKESLNRTITIVQESREKENKMTFDEWLDQPHIKAEGEMYGKMAEEAGFYDEEKTDEDVLNEDQISPEDEPRSTDGDPAVREHEEVDKVRDDNDAQLDDVYPEDAPHQEEPKMGVIGDSDGYSSDDEVLKMFQESSNFEPSPEIQALIEKGNEKAREIRKEKDEDIVLPE